MKKFFIAVILLVICAMGAYSIAYLVLPVNSMELSRYVHSVNFVCENAYIVRDETVYNSTSDGIVYNIAEDGHRVAQDEAISTIYDGDVNTDKLKKLHTIDTKISGLKTEGHDSDLYETDSDSSENLVVNKMSEVFESAAKNDVVEISNIKNEINSARKGSSASKTARIEALGVERDAVEKSISARKTDIVSDKAGIFSSYVDGLETSLTPSRVKKFTPAYLTALEPQNSEYINGKSIVSGKPVCKVMNNHIWYIAGIADKDAASLFEIDKSVTIRFTNLTETDVKGEISYVSEPDEDGNFVFVLKIGTYLESAFSYRTVNTQIIFEEHAGYKIPTDAIRTGEGISDYYVYARKGSEAYKCDVDILYSDTAEGYSIIASSKDADNNLGSMERVIVGER